MFFICFIVMQNPFSKIGHPGPWLSFLWWTLIGSRVLSLLTLDSFFSHQTYLDLVASTSALLVRCSFGFVALFCCSHKFGYLKFIFCGAHVGSKMYKKFELMLTGRAKAYGSSCSETVSLSPAISSRLLRGYRSLMPSCAGFLEPRKSRLGPSKSTFNAENFICS